MHNEYRRRVFNSCLSGFFVRILFFLDNNNKGLVMYSYPIMVIFLSLSTYFFSLKRTKKTNKNKSALIDPKLDRTKF